MAITVTCSCGASYTLKDEPAGKRLKCPKCQATFVADAPSAGPREIPLAPAAPPPMPAAPGLAGSAGVLGYASRAFGASPGGAGIFDRDKFLMRQKLLAMTAQKYVVSDEQGRDMVFAQRPYHVLKSLLAAVVAIATVAASVAAAFGLGFAILGNPNGRGPGDAIVVFIIVGLIVGIVLGVILAILIVPKRHVLFFADEAYTRPLLTVLQDSKWQLVTQTFTLSDKDGAVLAKLRKNIFSNIIRKRWRIYSPDGNTLLYNVMEDSILLSLLRRWLGPMFGALRTNFIFTDPTGELIIGEFNRKFTLLDKYVLDLHADPHRQLDRRVAVATGVMLDTGERR